VTQTNRTDHDAKITELKVRFARDGYVVLVEPQRRDLPFDLGDYLPDLVAQRADGGVIVEVKTGSTRTSVERYQSVARIVQQHRGWRFLFITVDDVNVPLSLQEIADWTELLTKLATIRLLIGNGYTEAATLYLWSIFEAAMRKLAIAAAIPIERLPATKLMNQLYTAGYMSIDAFAITKKFLIMRNGITHGFDIAMDKRLLASFELIVAGLIREWMNEQCNSEMLDD